MYKSYKIFAGNSFENFLMDTPYGTDLFQFNEKDKIANYFQKRLRNVIQGELNAEKLRKDWFPEEVKADIFISHSSTDSETLAKPFAKYLEKEFGITCFIDSQIWGCVSDLMKLIDDEYAKTSENLYSYEKRNNTTAHVHMILSYALTRMIDKTECFMFLETNNSISPRAAVESTYSPWIFHELAVVDTVEISILRDSIMKSNLSASSESRDFMTHPTPKTRNRLIELNISHLKKWVSCQEKKPRHPLDNLYEITNK